MRQIEWCKVGLNTGRVCSGRRQPLSLTTRANSLTSLGWHLAVPTLRLQLSSDQRLFIPCFHDIVQFLVVLIC